MRQSSHGRYPFYNCTNLVHQCSEKKGKETAIGKRTGKFYDLEPSETRLMGLVSFD